MKGPEDLNFCPLGVDVPLPLTLRVSSSHFICVCMCVLLMDVSALHVEGQKRTLYLLILYMGPGNQIQVLWKSTQCS